MLLKFSNILCFRVAAGQGKVGHVCDLRLQFVGSRAWRVELLIAGDVRSLTCAEAEVGRALLEVESVRKAVVAWSWHKLAHLSVRDVDTVTATEGVGGCAFVLITRAILEIILAGAWDSFLNILVDIVSPRMHADFGTFSNT